MIGKLRILTATPNHGRLDRLLGGLRNAGFEVVQEAGDPHCPNVVVLAGEKPGLPLDMVEELAGSCRAEDGMVTVLIAKTEIPRILQNTRIFDLSRWRGSEKNPDFMQLVNVLNTGDFESPRAGIRSSLSRTVRRWCAGLTATAIFSAFVFFVLNIMSHQNNVCSINFAQPTVSDLCGRFGLGGKPTRTERLAWEDVSERDCEALRRHIETFPTGAFRDDAADFLEARRIVEDETWVPQTKFLTLFVGQDGESAANEGAARALALRRAQDKADRLCAGFSNTSLYTLIAAEPRARAWDCADYASGVVCGFDGQAACDVKVRQIDEREICGSVQE